MKSRLDIEVQNRHSFYRQTILSNHAYRISGKTGGHQNVS